MVQKKVEERNQVGSKRRRAVSPKIPCDLGQKPPLQGVPCVQMKDGSLTGLWSPTCS